MDVYEPGSGIQIHDLNPTAFPPTGLFWTIGIPGEGIQVNLGKGAASMEAERCADPGLREHPERFILRQRPPPTPGSLSFKVVWSSVDERLNIQNDDPIYGGFAGEFIYNTAQMEWTATVGNFTFVSAPLATSSSAFAEIGRERNGIFFPS